MIKLITSAAYVDNELLAEYGQLPPAFLPMGNRRLYEAQIECLRVLPGRMILTVPESYNVLSEDNVRIIDAGAEILSVPDDLTLGESILYALELAGITSGPIYVLHGDTLIDLPLLGLTDLVAVAPPPETYKWGAIENDAFQNLTSDQQSVLCGYFVFSDVTELRRCLARSRGNFVDALRLYRDAIALHLIPVTGWLDFGHLQTFYRSRCSIRTQRSFNDLEMTFRNIEKTGDDGEKILAEATWFEGIPHHLRGYTPAFLGRKTSPAGQLSYMLEYLPLPTLHELFVFGALGGVTWARILGACAMFFSDCRRSSDPGHKEAQYSLRNLMLDKTLRRLEMFQTATDLSPDQTWRFDGHPLPSLRKIAEEASSLIDYSDSRFLGVMHGDFCFTNIFFDFRTRNIRVIDPRGTIDGHVPSVYGDTRYDLAKLCHSIFGGYDFILAGRYSLTGFDCRDLYLTFPTDSAVTTLPLVAAEIDFGGMRMNDPQIMAITTHLFLSMLPLHDDRPDRQKAFLANALRLFRMLETT